MKQPTGRAYRPIDYLTIPPEPHYQSQRRLGVAMFLLLHSVEATEDHLDRDGETSKGYKRHRFSSCSF